MDFFYFELPTRLNQTRNHEGCVAAPLLYYKMKLSVCISVCLSVPKYLEKYCTYIVKTNT